MTGNIRKYPIGIQTFSEIIQGGYVYVDKTDLMWNMTKQSKFIFLSRPRRFGKSLLSTTLESYFRGEKKLFDGLKIMQLEQEWTQYPVMHLDLSMAKNQVSAEELKETLMWLMRPLLNEYGTGEDETSPGKLLSGIIHRAYNATKKQVVIIIDEYDAPLLDVLHEDEVLDSMRMVMQEFYQPLKANEAMIKFCFITGITKFSQLSIFSTLNNLKNISLRPDFSAICGITEEEVRTIFAEDIKMMGERMGYSEEETFLMLKDRYDGYHFSHTSDDIYNPFSLLNAFCDMELKNFWFSTGTPTFLIKQLKHFNVDITQTEFNVTEAAFDQPTENMDDILPLLYQSGYLTIKDYEKETMTYMLAIPNREVKIGYTQGLLPVYVGLKESDVQLGFAAKFWKALKQHDLNHALQELQIYLEGIPYVEGFKKKLAEAATAEGFYEYTLYLIFSMLNVYVNTQMKCSHGRMDVVVFMPDTVYVLELKTKGTAQEALEQINERNYSVKFSTDGRNVVKAGLLFDMESRTLKEWVIK